MEQIVQKKSIVMHPVVSYFVIAYFSWVIFTHLQVFLAGGHYRHLLMSLGFLALVANRILVLIFAKDLAQNPKKLLKPTMLLIFASIALIGSYFVV
jgi:hypothetical protein